MTAGQLAESGANLSAETINRAWELAYASNIAYDALAKALGPEIMKHGSEDGEKITAEILLSDATIDSNNLATGDKRDMFKRIVGLANGYALMEYSPFAGPLDATSLQSETEQAEAEIEPPVDNDEFIPEPPVQQSDETDESESKLMATGKTFAGVQKHTKDLIRKAVNYLDALHEDYEPDGKISKEREEKELSKKTKYHLKVGTQELEVTLMGRNIVGMPEEVKLPLLLGQVRGPRRARVMNTPKKRRDYMLKMLNLGTGNQQIGRDYLSELISGAVQRREVFFDDEGEANITELGIRRLRNNEALKKFTNGGRFNNKSKQGF